MLLSGYIKLKYKHVAFKHWSAKSNHMAFNLHGAYLPTYLPCKVNNFVHNAWNAH